MPHALVGIQLRVLTCRFQCLEKPHAGTEENTLGAFRDQRRREAFGEVGIQPGNPGVGQIEAVGIGYGTGFQQIVVGT